MRRKIDATRCVVLLVVVGALRICRKLQLTLDETERQREKGKERKFRKRRPEGLAKGLAKSKLSSEQC